MKTNTMTISSPLLFGNVTFTAEIPVQSQPKLKKDGTPKNILQNKKQDKKTEVFAFPISDIKKITKYFIENEKWQHYLIFVVGINMARRIGDTIPVKDRDGKPKNENLPYGLLWKHFFNPVTGTFRNDLFEIVEDKTDKFATPHINSAVKKAIKLYCEKTGLNPADNDYNNPVFIQTSGNYKGRVISYDCYRKGLKKAAASIGFTENVAAHSTRKTFGMITKMIHPGDNNIMELLQDIFNHSSTKVTNRYIGMTKKDVDKCYDDMGNFWDKYIEGGENFKDTSNQPIISIDVNDLRDVIKSAYAAGADNAGATDPTVHLEAMNNILAMIDGLKK